jgi:type IV secretion system protein VirB1
MAAVVLTESGGWPWAIWDNTASRRYTLPNKATAIAVAKSLIAQGHKLDMGLAQIDSEWLPTLHLSVSQVFSPCENVRIGANLLSSNYTGAVAHGYQRGGAAIDAALQAYNSGQYQGDSKYVKAIYRSARAPYAAMPPTSSAIPALAVVPTIAGGGASLPPSPYTASLSVAVPPPPASLVQAQGERPTSFVMRFP